MAKLLTENEKLHKENEHLKQTYKDLYDFIKKTRVQTKDHNDSLIAKINSKTIENADLKAQIQSSGNLKMSGSEGHHRRRYERQYEDTQTDSAVEEYENEGEILEFEGRLCPDDFLDWLCTVDCIFDLRDTPDHIK
ncbi:hypothetical protein Tco_0193585, partial [Tanacetum coccineum]